jgi:hypothetical protein
MADQDDLATRADAVDEKPCGSISRREFARRAALASAVASIVPAAVTAQPFRVAPSAAMPDSQDTPPPARPAGITPQGPEPSAPKLSPESQSEADARFQAILVLYGSRFSNEQKNELHRLCSVVQPSLDHIRGYKIENGDGPALYLKPQYEREKKAKVAVALAPKPSAGPSAPPAKPAAGDSTPKKP